ncbi:MAG: ABC transporter permease [Phyllobacteriaceae bacterium]|jgi:ribose transport system permease protein|nr:ABC transporter permease [Phyllobacteriaceae bacterium]
MTELVAKPPASIGTRLLNMPGAAFITIALVPLFAFSNDAFLGASNLTNIMVQTSILLMVAVPMTYVILTEGLDISMGAVVSLCGVAMALYLADGGGLFVAILIACAVGAAFGAFNGVCVAYFQMPSFVVTLGTMGVAHGLALILTNASIVTGLGDQILALQTGSLAAIPYTVLIAISLYALAHLILYHTRFGTYVFAIGGNRHGLELAGIPVNLWHTGVYVFAGLYAGIAATLLTTRTFSAHPTVAIGMEFDAIAAVILGGTSFDRGKGWLFGTVLGVIAIGVLRNGLNLMAVSSSVQAVAIGLLVIGTLLLDKLRANGWRLT